MGFRNLHYFNLALLTKQEWRLISQSDSLYAQVMKAKYYLRKNFLHAKPRYAPSYLWRSLQHATPRLFEGLYWRVGDGKSINIWTDKWIPSSNNLRPLVPKVIPLNLCFDQ